MVKLINHIPITHNGIFRFQLDLKENYIPEFNKQKIIQMEKNCNLNYIGSDLNILNKFKKLNTEIKKTIKYFIENILCMESNFKIHRSWLTLTKPQGNSSSHTHDNCWLSGIYYPEKNEHFKIKFYNDIRNSFSTKCTKSTIYNSTSFTIVPEKNELILFFSNLRHEILTNESKKDRHSLAFNCLPAGFFGEGESKNEFI